MWPGEVRSCLGCWNLAISFLICHDSSSSQKNPPLSFIDLRNGSAGIAIRRSAGCRRKLLRSRLVDGADCGYLSRPLVGDVSIGRYQDRCSFAVVRPCIRRAHITPDGILAPSKPLPTYQVVIVLPSQPLEELPDNPNAIMCPFTVSIRSM